MWMPSLVDRAGPKYLRIADAIAEDVYAGRLKVGERLPTHRDLAWRLGVTVGLRLLSLLGPRRRNGVEPGGGLRRVGSRRYEVSLHRDRVASGRNLRGADDEAALAAEDIRAECHRTALRASQERCGALERGWQPRILNRDGRHLLRRTHRLGRAPQAALAVHRTSALSAEERSDAK